MAQKRASLERQLENAQNALAAYEQRRQGDADFTTDSKKDPHWRKLDAKRRDIATRLYRVTAIEKQQAEMAERRETAGTAN